MLTSAVAVLVLVGGAGFFALRAFTSTSQAPASAMPPDASLYVSVDLLQLLGEETTGPLVRTIERVLTDLGQDIAEPADLIADLDRELLADVGFDFSNDIRPWIGRTMGFSLLTAGWDPLDYTSNPEGLFVVEVRDEQAAADFLAKVRGAAANEGVLMQSAGYLDVDLLVWEEDSMGLALTVSDGMLLAGTRTGVERGIDAQRGVSLLDTEAFTAATSQLPDTRLLTGWVGSELYRDVYQDIVTAPYSVGGVGYPDDLAEGWSSMAFSATVTDTGIAFDAAMLLDGEDLPPWYDAQVAATGTVPPLLPADTLAFVEYGSPASIWTALEDFVADTAPEYEGELDSLATDLGFHPIDDFVAHLDGDLGVALLRSRAGMMAVESGYPIGLVAFAGTSSPETITTTLTDVNLLLKAEGAPIAPVPSPDGTLFTLEEDGVEVVAYGVRDGNFLIGSSSAAANAIGANGPDVTDNATYQAAVDALAGDYQVSFFVDIAALAEVFEAEGDVGTALQPFQAVVGGAQLGDEVYRGTVLLVIDYDD